MVVDSAWAAQAWRHSRAARPGRGPVDTLSPNRYAWPRHAIFDDKRHPHYENLIAA